MNITLLSEYMNCLLLISELFVNAYTVNENEGDGDETKAENFK